jgi:hypothetical protein
VQSWKTSRWSNVCSVVRWLHSSHLPPPENSACATSKKATSRVCAGHLVLIRLLSQLFRKRVIYPPISHTHNGTEICSHSYANSILAVKLNRLVSVHICYAQSVCACAACGRVPRVVTVCAQHPRHESAAHNPRHTTQQSRYAHTPALLAYICVQVCATCVQLTAVIWHIRAQRNSASCTFSMLLIWYVHKRTHPLSMLQLVPHAASRHDDPSARQSTRRRPI